MTKVKHFLCADDDGTVHWSTGIFRITLLLAALFWCGGAPAMVVYLR